MTSDSGPIVPSAPRSRPKKSLGQNFLVDSRVARKIVSTAEVGPDDTILEIGPGRGALTRHLAEASQRLVAVELDSELAAQLESRYSDDIGVEIIRGDARDISLDQIFNADESYKVVANLPYYAANRIVRRFLTAERKPSLLVFMVQREVARTMAAEPGDMGLLSVMVQLYGSVKVAFSVPPKAFRPAPKVTSAVVRIDVFDEPALDLDSEEGFFDLVIAGFSAPRKQIRNSLKNGLNVTGEVASDLLDAAEIDPKRRPETLSVREWGQVYDRWRTLNQ
ncbi:MAG: 16S rRNA (adenine(1518)-N(6)/adenine(1519)-N(6))-dimethyltransferase RsmA [SAR202 cluster bacterium]|jgi:16S rRNA (adenine1518-N6/adenine1519-N6)-dimethyltransferase|nr:16S rRNA (adenine(1518)-N(6)/adenine(1519)-N(6))-dimethyltransferase RsmA [SAR202 cluster bacterium]MDP6513707.1 16S rRNA (adenine(1518)-N(6)/adenine(1519)-N(6))-dimethyltransferase RsmA [SAR202 cluster bacterium]